MKTYFAKLADRATLANVPALSTVYAGKVSDPFEETSQSQSPLPPLEFGSRRRSSAEPDSFALSHKSPDTLFDSTRPMVETEKRVLPEPPAASATILPSSPAKIPATEHASYDKAERELDQQRTSLTERSLLESDPARVVMPTPIQAPDLSTTQSKTPGIEELAKESVAEKEFAEERLAHLEQEQSVLLRKADAFMGRLLDRRREPPTDPEISRTRESPRDLKANVQTEQANRLQPIHSPARPAAQESDRPSLVIGKLTVEVMPAAPPPAAPQPRVVVVRGGRGRGNGLSSGRRFGLGQF